MNNIAAHSRGMELDDLNIYLLAPGIRRRGKGYVAFSPQPKARPPASIVQLFSNGDSNNANMTTGRSSTPKPPLFFTVGNRNRRRPLPEPMPFDPPFPLDAIALQEWERILSAVYWLKETEAFAIADRCVCAARLLECEHDIQTRGHVIRTRNGKVLNPSVRVARSYRISLQRHDAELGLTASSRGRLVEAMPTFNPGSMDDPLERALCGPDRES